MFRRILIALGILHMASNIACLLASLKAFLPSTAIAHMSSDERIASSVISNTMFTLSGVFKPYCLVPAASFQGSLYSIDKTLLANFLHVFPATIGLLPAPWS